MKFQRLNPNSLQAAPQMASWYGKLTRPWRNPFFHYDYRSGLVSPTAGTDDEEAVAQAPFEQAWRQLYMPLLRHLGLTAVRILERQLALLHDSKRRRQYDRLLRRRLRREAKAQS